MHRCKVELAVPSLLSINQPNQIIEHWRLRIGYWLLNASLPIVLVAVSCGKPKEKPAAAPAAEKPAAGTETSAPQVAPAVTQGLRETDAALNAKDYEKAAVSLMQMEMSRQPLSREESIAYSGKMRDLQSRLAEAAARGDPRAEAAIRLLRSSRGPR